MIVVGLDPSLRATGWVAIEMDTRVVISVGVIVTQPGRARRLKSSDDTRRGLQIYCELHRLFDRIRPGLVVQEAISGSRSSRGASASALAQQACADAAVNWTGHPLFILPTEAKLAVAGTRYATKMLVQERVRELIGDLPLNGIKKSLHSHVWDAAALVLAAWNWPELVAIRCASNREDAE
jgi:Holliday junction resolvasome RuvABC endonuclease subunit